MSTDHHPLAETSKRNRSAISNGSWLLEGVDNRSALGRRFRDLCTSYADDMGGQSQLTEPQRAQIRQVASVTIESEKLQAAIVRGEPVDHENLVRVNNLQARLIKQLGISPKSAKAKGPSLKDLLAKRAAAE